MDDAKGLNVFTDASEEHCGCVVTQVPKEQQAWRVEDQDYQPLLFLSGNFTGTASRWPFVEKKAYALIETVK